MEFGLSDEQLVLQDTARRFAKTEIAPVAAQYDQSGEFPRDLIKRAWELGLSSTCIPPEFDGVGLSTFESCLATEELACPSSSPAPRTRRRSGSVPARPSSR
jgi:acyl-CoA dehydrogenase